MAGEDAVRFAACLAKAGGHAYWHRVTVGRLRWTLGLTAALAASGCDLLEGSEATEPPALAKQAPSNELAELGRRVAFGRYQLQQRLLSPLKPPSELVETKCPDDTIARATPTRAARLLLLDSQDDRAVAKDLLPVTLTEWLTTGDVQRLDRRFGSVGEPRRLLPTVQAGREALDELAALEARRYKGVYHVILYVEPRLQRRKWPKKPRWLPGWVLAWFAVHDLETGRALCQVELSVKNDVSDASTSRRMRSTVEKRFVSELGERLRRESKTALARISDVLVLPSAK